MFSVIKRHKQKRLKKPKLIYPKKDKKIEKKNAILTNRIGKITTKVKKFRFNQIFEMLKHLQQ